MKENKYDDLAFFDKYSRFPRSAEGLCAAGEWHELCRMLPPFLGKRVLDLGCGFGWHCIYAAEQGAKSVVGVDISERMLNTAKSKTNNKSITYMHSAIEDYDYPQNAFDMVISSLAFHYVQSFNDVCQSVKKALIQGGDFIFSVEHPVFTAEGRQDWIYDESGNISHFAINNYFYEGLRNTVFLEENVIKYHRRIDTYLKNLLSHGFSITDFCEPAPPEEFIKQIPAMKDELRRPMMMIISAKKV